MQMFLTTGLCCVGQSLRRFNGAFEQTTELVDQVTHQPDESGSANRFWLLLSRLRGFSFGDRFVVGRGKQISRDSLSHRKQRNQGFAGRFGCSPAMDLPIGTGVNRRGFVLSRWRPMLRSQIGFRWDSNKASDGANDRRRNA